jgi:hypothetical protein
MSDSPRALARRLERVVARYNGLIVELEQLAVCEAVDGRVLRAIVDEHRRYERPLAIAGRGGAAAAGDVRARS